MKRIKIDPVEKTDDKQYEICQMGNVDGRKTFLSNGLDLEDVGERIDGIA